MSCGIQNLSFRFYDTHQCCRLPFHVRPDTHPELPTEIWEYIVDWIAASRSSDGLGDLIVQNALLSCCQVCRAWLDRARIHLYSVIYLWHPIGASKLENTIRRTRASSPLIKSLAIKINPSSARKQPPVPESALFIPHRLMNLKTLRLWRFDLSRQHPYIFRAIAPRTILHLHLNFLKLCKVTQLIRFINTFHSLTSLKLHFNSYILETDDQILSSPRAIPGRSLTSLDLWLVPGCSIWVDWYIREGAFLANLQDLGMHFYGRDDNSGFSPCIEGAEDLLDHCSQTIMDLTVDIETAPMKVIDMRIRKSISSFVFVG